MIYIRKELKPFMVQCNGHIWHRVQEMTEHFIPKMNDINRNPWSKCLVPCFWNFTLLRHDLGKETPKNLYYLFLAPRQAVKSEQTQKPRNFLGTLHGSLALQYQQNHLPFVCVYENILKAIPFWRSLLCIFIRRRMDTCNPGLISFGFFFVVTFLYRHPIKMV